MLTERSTGSIGGGLMVELEELEQESDRFVSFKNTLAHSGYEMGKILLNIKERKLHLLKYQTWAEYLANRLDVSERSAYRFMRVAQNFDQERVEQWGVHKLDLFLQAEEPQREELFKLPASTPVRKIAETVQQMNPRTKSGNFFAEVEMSVISAVPKVREAQDYLAAAKLNPDWVTYHRRALIETMWKEIKEEVIKSKI